MTAREESRMLVRGLDEFTRAYLKCALWTSTYSDGKRDDRRMDSKFSLGSIHPNTLKQAAEDCRVFQEKHADDIASDLARAGHDFWLTRNGHGAGFWGGDWPEVIGEKLTEASKAYGEINLGVDDNGVVYGL
jgi:hypothetical protein